MAQFFVGDKVSWKCLRAQVETFDFQCPERDLIGIRLENGNFKWVTAEELTPRRVEVYQDRLVQPF
jgi:hypothetical protein